MAERVFMSVEKNLWSFQELKMFDQLDATCVAGYQKFKLQIYLCDFVDQLANRSSCMHLIKETLAGVMIGVGDHDVTPLQTSMFMILEFDQTC